MVPMTTNCGRKKPLTCFFLLLTMTSVQIATPLNFSAVLSSLSKAPPAVSPLPSSASSTTTSPIIKKLDLNVPNIRLSYASDLSLNSLYIPRDPKTIPKGFIRACGKAGGYAPRPVWDSITNGITPWFENKDGCFIYFNCNDSHWWIDSEQGAGLYLAAPNGSLLLPPTGGWMALTGERAGAPKMNFV
ncbi:hypothetical protein ACHAWC_006508 [Mediolabrus comicus]